VTFLAVDLNGFASVGTTDPRGFGGAGARTGGARERPPFRPKPKAAGQISSEVKLAAH